jgi:magnesium chelatase family protein
VEAAAGDRTANRLRDLLIISGPLLDRIDIHIEVPAVKYKELRAPSSAEDSAAVRQRLIAARDRQLER